MAVTRIISAFRPNRAYRRNVAGVRCTLCGLGVTAPDLALLEAEHDHVRVDTSAIHTQCTALLWDMAAELNGGEDDTEEPDGVPSEADPA